MLAGWAIELIAVTFFVNIPLQKNGEENMSQDKKDAISLIFCLIFLLVLIYFVISLFREFSIRSLVGALISFVLVEFFDPQHDDIEDDAGSGD